MNKTYLISEFLRLHGYDKMLLIEAYENGLIRDRIPEGYTLSRWCGITTWNWMKKDGVERRCVCQCSCGKPIVRKKH